MRVKVPDGPEFNVGGKLVATALGIAAVLALLLTSFFTVEPQEEAVVLRFGRHVRTLGPGLHFKLPLGIEEAIKVPVSTVEVEEFGYRSVQSGGRQAPGGSKTVRRGYEYESTMLTGDLNIVMVGWDVQYRRSEPEKYLFRVQEPIKTLRDISQSVMREVIGDRASIQVLTVERAEIQAAAKEAIQRTVDELDMGLQIVEVNLLFVDPPNEVIDSFHDLNKAEQDAQRYFEEASREYEERVNKARGTAARTVSEAEGYRERRVNVAQGEAERFTSILAEYRKAPEVTRRRLYLETLEELLPKVKEVVVTDGSAASTPLPLLDLRRGTVTRKKEGK
ncbi:MAG: FtsH protease activity modulator HflK [Deltaproteobacteria bacterium]|nr:MAG: FtsH protease activity modulator HflK [Deltaproteobacteria bacterium]